MKIALATAALTRGWIPLRRMRICILISFLVSSRTSHLEITYDALLLYPHTLRHSELSQEIYFYDGFPIQNNLRPACSYRELLPNPKLNNFKLRGCLRRTCYAISILPSQVPGLSSSFNPRAPLELPGSHHPFIIHTSC